MSNPISALPDTDATTHHDEPEVAVDEFLDEDSSTAEQATENGSSETPYSADLPADESKGRSGLIALILAILLVGSVAINLKQSGDVASLEAKSSEFERALTAAVARIDLETARADGAEAALQRVDSAVDVVNESVLGLQDALDGLREATIR